ncbi:hypothetical protein GC207_08730 [bacterium]|nr:hypothetical protein [bacterium]
MGRKLQNVTFEQWLDFAFNHPVTKPAWHWADDADLWAGSATEMVDLLTRTFLDSGTALQSFSDAQLNQGFWYLISVPCSDIACSITNGRVSNHARIDCVKAIVNLFRDCFALRCSNHLSHLDEAGANPLNSICYMWWDLFPVFGKPKEPKWAEFDSLILEVMGRVLDLDSDACREAALHGLGESHCYYPDRTPAIVENFIWKHRHIRDSLRNYAYAAMHGDVL